ncbi:unannotated protein [freshwater metagenome]|uniref:Unannotated protein n=1 Tax=freshwater metagenome TaxID=449393 RepID=A0A6J5Y9E3_9ZZZZ
MRLRERLVSSKVSRRALPGLWAAMVLIVGLSAAYASATNSRAALLLVVVVAGGTCLITIFSLNVNILYGTAFAVLPWIALSTPGIGLPIGELLMGIAVVVAVTQNRRRREPLPAFPKVMACALVAMMTISGVLNPWLGIFAAKRIGHVCLYCAVFLTIGVGLFPRRVIQKGMLIGLAIASFFGIVYLMAGLAPFGYPGRLTGLLFGDPNPAALAILALGFLSIDIVPAGSRRNSVIAALAIPFLLTQSRGALVGLALAIVWWAIARRFRPAAGLAIITGTSAAISVLPTTLQDIGIFGSRSGSDVLRASILAESTKAAVRGFWTGNGPGTGLVRVYGSYNFFFHNSYLAVISEGGIISAAIISSLLLVHFLRLIALPMPVRNTWIEMAMIVIATAGFHLGEVLLDLPAAVAIGLCIDWIARPETGRSLAQPTLGLRETPRRVLTQ